MVNNENIRFSEIPKVQKPRSRFDRSFSVCDTFNTGELVPLDVQEVYPGDTITVDFAHVTRSMTPIAPVMDNSTLEVAAFFVPRRLTWTHWPEFMGEVNLDNGGHWKPTVEYRIPKIQAPDEGWSVGSLADHLGFPVGVGNIQVDRAPFTAYCKIWNDWFRTEALKDPCYMTMDETTLQGINKGANYDYVTDTELGAACAKVARQFDYFSSALPEPQRGPDTPIPLGTTAPILGKNMGANTDTHLVGKELYATNISNDSTLIQIAGLDAVGGLQPQKYIGWEVDLSNATSATINQLRQAYAVQRYYEAMARGGGRMISMIENIFGVQSEDARLQRAEFCGGAKFEINIDQVLQTSATDNTSPQGHTAAFSCTVNAANLATYSATEHGIWMVVGWIRTHRSYAQGINRMWTRDKLTDFYVPQFAHLGEQGILNKEIYAQGSTAINPNTNNAYDEEVFGYQECWAELRYTPSQVKGLMRPNVQGTLAYWNYADKYDALPHLSSEWIDETDANVQRTLAVQNQPQWLINGYFKSTWTRVLPMYGIPGLQDHF